MFRNLFRKHMLIFLSAFIFAVWMLFCDKYSVVNRYATNRKISELQEQYDRYSDSYNADSLSIEEIKRSKINLEKYAREHYYMKSDNEDIFIVVE